MIQKFEKLLGISIPEAVVKGGEMKILSEMDDAARAEAEAEAIEAEAAAEEAQAQVAVSSQ